MHTTEMKLRVTDTGGGDTAYTLADPTVPRLVAQVTDSSHRSLPKDPDKDLICIDVFANGNTDPVASVEATGRMGLLAWHYSRFPEYLGDKPTLALVELAAVELIREAANKGNEEYDGTPEAENLPRVAGLAKRMRIYDAECARFRKQKAVPLAVIGALILLGLTQGVCFLLSVPTFFRVTLALVVLIAWAATVPRLTKMLYPKKPDRGDIRIEQELRRARGFDATVDEDDRGA